MSTQRPVSVHAATWRVLIAAAVACVSASGSAFATVVIPPRNLGELAASSPATVVAVAGRSWVEASGETLVTQTAMVVQEEVSGPLAAGTEFVVTVPGGELEDKGWLVPGSPRFVEGATYLLFLSRDGSNGWRPQLLAYGVLEKTTGARGDALLAPVAEAGQMLAWERPDGDVAEKTVAYRQDALIGLLRHVTRGEAEWDAGKAAASSGELPLRPQSQGLEYGCPMIGDDSGYGVRWDRFDSGKTVSVYSESRGEPELGADGGHRQVKEALETWMGVAGTDLNLSYGGKKSYSLSCGSGFDAPSSSANVVVFGDPCSDLGSMSGCAGIAAYGGPWYSGSHMFNGRKWRTAVGLYVVVNDGAPCIGADMYRRLLAHELGHCLGFAHSSDSASLMYAYCCNKVNDTDEACARYVYPGNNPGAPSSPEEVTASDGTVAGAVTVLWRTAAGAVRYEVWRSDGSALAGAQPLGEVGAATFTDSTATPGNAYTYWVRGLGAGTLGEFGSPDSGYASCAEVGRPELVAPQAVVSGQSYAVGWQEVPGAASYLVEEAETPEFSGATQRSVEATSVMFQHAVSAQRSFYYRVRPAVPCGITDAPADFSSTAAVTVVPTDGQAENARHVSYIAGVARAVGAGGENWRTDLELRNPGETSTTAIVELLRMNVENAELVSKAVTIDGGSTASFEDVLETLFGSSGAGVLRISSDSPGLIASARTYNQTSSGSFGQFVPEIDEGDVLTPAHPGRLVQLAHATDRSHGRRTNIGIINESAAAARVEVRLFASSGQRLGIHTVDLGQHGAIQLNDVFAGLTAVDLLGAYAIVVPIGEEIG